MSISRRSYNFIIGLVLLYGFVANWWMVTNISTASLVAIPQWAFLIGYFVSCLIGIGLYHSSDNPVVSFIGYNFIVVPFGLLLNIFLAPYSADLIRNAVLTTGIATMILMALGTIFPAFFKSIASALFWGLLAAIVAELVMAFFFHVHPVFMDWIVALIFCGYIGYDFAIANEKPATLDNAVDSAASLYVDIINLFVRILSIMGGSKD
jgi:FtsH-binding integral membrane protein